MREEHSPPNLPLLRGGISMYHPLEKGNSQFQTILPLEKGELEGDKNPLNPKILRKEKLHDKQTSTLLSEASLLYS